MPKTITQSIRFKGITPAQLYALYMNAKLHAQVTGAPAKIQNKAGAAYSVYSDYCFGKNLHLEQDRMIVQTWRSTDFAKTDPDSIFCLLFEAQGADTLVHMTHAYLPDDQAASVKKGWVDFYWKPWKEHLNKS